MKFRAVFLLILLSWAAVTSVWADDFVWLAGGNAQGDLTSKDGWMVTSGDELIPATRPPGTNDSVHIRHGSVMVGGSSVMVGILKVDLGGVLNGFGNLIITGAGSVMNGYLGISGTITIEHAATLAVGTDNSGYALVEYGNLVNHGAMTVGRLNLRGELRNMEDGELYLVGSAGFDGSGYLGGGVTNGGSLISNGNSLLSG